MVNLSDVAIVEIAEELKPVAAATKES